MIITTNILAAPLILLIWAADMLLLMISLRFLFDHLPSLRASKLSQLLHAVTDPAQQAISRRLAASRGRTASPSACWAILIVGLILLHHLLAWIILSVCSTANT